MALVHTKNKCYSSGETGCEAAHKIWEFEFQVCSSSLKQFRGGFERFSGAFEGIPPAAQELRGRQEGKTEEDGREEEGRGGGEARKRQGERRGRKGKEEPGSEGEEEGKRKRSE